MNIYSTQCPHCNQKGFIPDVAISNVAFYGDNNFHLKCVHCKKMAQVSLRRVVDVAFAPSKSDHTESDFAE